jgi:hypothetical protein
MGKCFFEKPALPESTDKNETLQSKEVFFSLSYKGGIYHGWYIARPIEKNHVATVTADVVVTMKMTKPNMSISLMPTLVMNYSMKIQ